MEFETETTYYDPSEAGSGEYLPLPKGKYVAFIKEFNMNKENWVSNDNQHADIYEAKYTLDKESLMKMTLRDDKGNELNPVDFVNKEIRSKGFFLFKDHPGGNKRINILLQAVNYPMDSKEVTNTKGEKIKVQAIPMDIDDTKLIGQPVLIEVGHEMYKEKIYEKEFQLYQAPNTVQPKKVEEEVEEDLPF